MASASREVSHVRDSRSQRVKLALGADGRRIVGLVIREGLGWTAAGISAGMLAALALSRYVSSLLFTLVNAT